MLRLAEHPKARNRDPIARGNAADTRILAPEFWIPYRLSLNFKSGGSGYTSVRPADSLANYSVARVIFPVLSSSPDSRAQT
jgi:hypothetical protein